MTTRIPQNEMTILADGVARIDPLYSVLRRLFRSQMQAALAVGALHALVWIVLSLIVQKELQKPGAITLLDFRNDAFGWFQWVLLVPVLWYFYRWLPEGVTNALMRLCRNGVIDFRQSGKNRQSDDPPDYRVPALLADLSGVLARPLWTWLSVATATIIVLGQYFVHRPSELGASFLSAWYATRWSVYVLEPLTGINGYVCAQFAIRTIVSTLELRRYFSKSELKHVFLLHPDGGGGLGQLGRLSMQVALFSVFIGFWAVGITLYPVAYGYGGPNFSIAVLTVYALYAVLVPSTLLAILWPAHMAMKRYKYWRLHLLSLQIQELLESLLLQTRIETRTTTEAVENLGKLRGFYQLTKDIPEWPLSLPDFGRFGGFAALPAITGLVSFALDFAKSWPF